MPSSKPGAVQTAANGPRYKALGNTMAVNAMEFIGARIELVRALIEVDPRFAADRDQQE